jgi:hypothetical protein
MGRGGIVPGRPSKGERGMRRAAVGAEAGRGVDGAGRTG